jgi:Holliday junction resolvase RusA-like endonuclease
MAVEPKQPKPLLTVAKPSTSTSTSPRSPKPAKAPPAPRGRTEPWRATIIGELASKANSRRLVTLHGLPRFIKSDKARAYLPALLLQVPILNPMFEEEVAISVTAFYASHRPDLDISLLLDALQGRVYRNDRQVREQHLYHAIDKVRPRVEVTLSLREPVSPRAFADSEE